MYCAYCGKKIPEGALFCSYCGEPLKEDDDKNNRQQFTDNNNLKQKNKGKRRRILIPVVILVICIGLAVSLFFIHFIGDEIGITDEQHTEADASEEKEEKEDMYLWNITFNGNQYDLGKGFEAVTDDVTDKGGYVVGIRTGRILKDDQYAGMTLGQLKKEGIELDWDELFAVDFFDFSTNSTEDMNEVFIVSFGAEGIDNLKNFESADGLNRHSKERDLPFYFTPMGIYGIRNRYYAIIVDGKAFDISPYLNEVPDEITDEYLSGFLEAIEQFQKKSFYAMLPIYFKGPEWKTNTDNEAHQAFAAAEAFMDVYRKYQGGEINSIGTISYSFVNGKADGCDYQILQPIY